jgi:FkbM family methyltransferase
MLSKTVPSAHGLRGLARFIFGKALPKTAYPVLRGPLKGTRFILGAASGKGGGASVYFNLVEPEKTNAFVSTLKTSHVLFDIGANMGYYTLLGSRLVGFSGKVLAFEPVVRNLAYLYRHVALNKVKNVFIIPAACSNRLAIADFSLGVSLAEGHLALDQVDQQEYRNPKNTMIVPTITVDEVVGHTGIFPDVLKIDVEGSEFLVLQGACKTLIETKPIILLAVHSLDLYSVCTDYLQKMDYTFEIVCGNDQGDAELLAMRA